MFPLGDKAQQLEAMLDDAPFDNYRCALVEHDAHALNFGHHRLCGRLERAMRVLESDHMYLFHELPHEAASEPVSPLKGKPPPVKIYHQRTEPTT